LAPNGEKLTHFEQLDFNALYAGMQARNLPTTPGVKWTKSGDHFKKSVMADGVSFPAIQWLYYLQASAPYLTKSDGGRAVIDHGYHQGEAFVGVDKVDGYCKVEGKVYILEFLGCYYHGCKCQEVPDLGARYKWETKKRRLEKAGTLIFIWECHWEIFKADDPTIIPTITHFPRILYDVENLSDLPELIKSDQFFGFIHCDLW